MHSAAVIEVIASTVHDCVEIEKGGAQRIQLVSALEVGGLTPSLGLIRRTKEATSLPINVMIRPHSLSFSYSEEDLEVMLQDIDYCKTVGVNGVVFGVLDSNNQIDLGAVRKLVHRADDLNITFHKAFDETEDLAKSLQSLEQFKQINRILTQGGNKPILENLEHLSQLASSTNKTILLGGGLRHTNIATLRKSLDNCEYHFGTAVREHGKVSSELVKNIVKLCQEHTL